MASTTRADNANLYALFEDRFTGAADQTAFQGPNIGTLAYGALAAEVARYANALESLGVMPGDRVMAQVDKSIPNVCLYLATLKIGAVYNPLNSAYTAAELEYFIGDAEPALVVVAKDRVANISGFAKNAKVRHLLTMNADGSGSIADATADKPAKHKTCARNGDDLASLLYTSGTTGRSKGAMLSHDNLASNAQTLHAYWGFVPGDVLLHALPIFHTHGLFVALHTAFLNASTMLWLEKFDLEKALDLLPRASVMMGVPTFYTRLLGDKRFARTHCRNMRLVISGSAPLLAETHKDFEARTGHKILERYGMTEAGMITSNPYQLAKQGGGDRIAGTVGYALPGVSLRVADPQTAKVLPQGEVGVIEIKGRNVFKGYWRNPEKTKEEFRADGWFITADLATLDPDGRVTIVGRAKDLIISGGYNVYPKEIESEINALPGVAESAVIGIPHADFGEGVVAAVTCQPGAKPPSETDIIGALEGRLAKFKLPKRVFVVDELPRNAMGKVEKAVLRKRYLDTFSA